MPERDSGLPRWRMAIKTSHPTHKPNLLDSKRKGAQAGGGESTRMASFWFPFNTKKKGLPRNLPSKIVNERVLYPYKTNVLNKWIH